VAALYTAEVCRIWQW